MLKFIQCEKLRQKHIDFHAGLNAVLGDSAAHNSIGKSSLLLMIDFVFGGNAYASSRDIITELGHHQIQWCMEFEGVSYFYSRDTQKKDTVIQCNDKFEPIRSISTSYYCSFLAQKQGCVFPDMTYRGFVGSFSRIWGRKNEDITHPLKQGSSTQKEDALKFLHFFEKYEKIKDQKNLCDNLNAKKSALSTAAKHDLIPDIGARDYKDNLSTLADFELEINELKASITGHEQESIVLVSSEYSECKSARAQLFLHRNMLQERLKRTKVNLLGNNSTRTQLDKLITYFPHLNVEKLAEVDSFHQKLSKILKDEISSSIKEVQKQIDEVESEIAQLSEKMDQLLKCDDSTKYVVDRLTTIISSKQHIEACNEHYLKKKELEKQIKQASEMLDTLWETVLTEIQQAVNQKLQEIIDSLYDTERHAPILNLDQKTYKLIGREDTGTGTAYVNLIAFDMAISSLTKLPILIHDSMLFKNVETPALERIFAEYPKLSQQIFIAIDEVTKFNDDIQKLLISSAVSQLTETETLFIKDWKKR